MTFLSIITRHMPQRKAMLKTNHASLKMQTEADWEHCILTDDIGRGWEHAAKMLVKGGKMATGRYVLILDDDDLMVNANGICELKRVTYNNPPGVIFKGWHGDGLGILPPSLLWGKRPRKTAIGSFDFILRRDVFNEFVETAVNGGYENDYTLISSAYDKYGDGIIWLDMLICAVMQRGRR